MRGSRRERGAERKLKLGGREEWSRAAAFSRGGKRWRNGVEWSREEGRVGKGEQEDRLVLDGNSCVARCSQSETARVTSRKCFCHHYSYDIGWRRGVRQLVASFAPARVLVNSPCFFLSQPVLRECVIVQQCVVCDAIQCGGVSVLRRVTWRVSVKILRFCAGCLACFYEHLSPTFLRAAEASVSLCYDYAVVYDSLSVCLQWRCSTFPTRSPRLFRVAGRVMRTRLGDLFVRT